MEQSAAHLFPGRAAEDAGAPHDRKLRPPARLSVRTKGMLAFVGMVLYLILVGAVVSEARHKLLLMVGELERLHRHEEMLVQSNIAVAHAILAVNDSLQAGPSPASTAAVLAEIESVDVSLQGLRMHFSAIAANLAALHAGGVHLRQTPTLGDLVVIRRSLNDLVSVLDGITREERDKKQSLLAGYRVAHDAVTVEMAVLGMLGVVVLGGMTVLFFSRLAWDIGKLEERAMDIVMGYRGAPLEVTRGDEVGGLMEALNNMQTELREREKQLELTRQQRFHQEKMAAVGSLAAALAHEINNPLAAIAGIAETIVDVRNARNCPSGGIDCQPELILDQTRRVALITRQISEFTAPHSQEPGLLDLNALVRSTCSFVGYDRRFKNIELKTDLDDQLPALYAVGDHLAQVLMNLLINAADAMETVSDKRAPVISVSTRVVGDHISITVTDNGVGMSDETRERAFEEYYTTKPVGKGTGLGLALCKGLIEAHGGSVRLASRVGLGTTVFLDLPIGAEASATA